MIASILYWQIADSKFGNPFEIQSSSNNGIVYGRNPDQLGQYNNNECDIYNAITG